MRRSKHGLSHYRLFTANIGQLIPTTWFEALPGDTMRLRTSALIRFSPLVAPVMHPIQIRFHWWFVPNRIIWPTANGTFEDFITGGKDGLGNGATHPISSTQAGGVNAKSVADYLGIPPSVGSLNVNYLPFLAYDKIYNEYYRDQDIVGEATTPLNTGLPHNIAYEKDYFSSARSSPQKGPDITLPIGGSAPVFGDLAFDNVDGAGNRVNVNDQSGNQKHLKPGSAGGFIYGGNNASGTSALYADLSNATAANVNDYRRAFALQRYAENRMRWGSRLTEYLAFLGIRSSDARLQRAEYITGGKSVAAFSEVLQTTEDGTNQNPLGRMGGHGITAVRSRAGIKFFEEHGIVMCLMSVRPKAMYSNALERKWSRKTKEDYWQKELEQIGMQEVYRREVFAEADAAGAGGDTVFGYNDRYLEYKTQPSSVASEFRNTLNYWHLSREFSSAPALNPSFVEVTPTEQKRIHAEQSNDSLWCMVNHSVQARRLVSKRSSNRIY